MSEQELENIVDSVMQTASVKDVDVDKIRLMLELACLKGYQSAIRECINDLKKLGAK